MTRQKLQVFSAVVAIAIIFVSMIAAIYPKATEPVEYGSFYAFCFAFGFILWNWPLGKYACFDLEFENQMRLLIAVIVWVTLSATIDVILGILWWKNIIISGNHWISALSVFGGTLGLLIFAPRSPIQCVKDYRLLLEEEQSIVAMNK